MQPLARKALVITRYVSEGNVLNRVQLLAASYVRPVSSATARIPPSLSITAGVVVNSIIWKPIPKLSLDCKPHGVR